MNYPDVYLSGGFDLNYDLQKQVLERSGSKHRCFSFAFLLPENIHYSNRVVECQKACEEAKVKIMLDSGAYSLHSISRASSKRGSSVKIKQSLDIEQLQREFYNKYIGYVKEKLKQKKLSFFVTLDYKKEQPLIYNMQHKFLKDGLNPTPVFHGDSPIYWLHKYIDLGHKFICIGSVKRKRRSKEQMFFFDEIFNFGEKYGVKYHGLATTNLEGMIKFPWKSVDSTSWTLAASYGCLMLPPNGFKSKFSLIHVSNKRASSSLVSYNQLSLSQRSTINEYVSSLGFDINKLRKSTFEREVWNAYIFANLKEILTVSIIDHPKWENMLI